MTLRLSHPLAIIPWLTVAIFLTPVILGLVGTWLPAFGWFPAIGLDRLSLAPWSNLFSHPSFPGALRHTLVTGLGAAALALVSTALLLIGAYPSALFSWLEKSLAPILSIPHAAFAIGMSFLLVPSGWLVRLLALMSDRLDRPPLWSTFQDPHGISLIVTLALKEIPFLLLMCLAILPTLKAQQTLWLANSLGHSNRFAWLWLIFPQLYRQIRLPFFAVLAYSLTVVDIAVIAGPTTPATLAVLITQWFNDPDLSQRTVGAAGAATLLMLLSLIMAGALLLENPLRRLRSHCLERRLSGHWPAWEKPMARLISFVLLFFYAAALLITLIWGLAAQWRYPDVLPSRFSLDKVAHSLTQLSDPLWCTLLLATLSALLAITVVVGCLENEVRLKYDGQKVRGQKILVLLYLPLLIPQIAFIFGFQVWLIRVGLDGTFVALLWSHLVFVVPYVFLTLSGPYRQFDDRFSWLALSLTGRRAHSFWRIKLIILLRPILYAFATGFAVSIAQYLPTIFVGAGRFATLTTEAVALASGSDRRLMAVMALWQQLLPLIVFALATLIPAYRFRHRRAMSQTVS